MTNYNLTDMGVVTDVNLIERLSTKTNTTYKVLKLTLATGGGIDLYLKAEQAELLAFMAETLDKSVPVQVQTPAQQ